MGNNWGDTKWNGAGAPLAHIAKLLAGLEQANLYLGRCVAWLGLFMALTTFALVVARYGLSIGSIKAQESVLYMHAILFMLSGAYCFQHGMHVRIDIFYAGISEQSRALIDICGIVFLLLPTLAFLFYISLDYVFSSWSYRETSIEPDGLPYRYLLKTVLLMMPISIILQGLSDLCRHYFFIRGWIVYPTGRDKDEIDIRFR